MLLTIPSKKSGGYNWKYLCWTDPVPKGLFKELDACTLNSVCNMHIEYTVHMHMLVCKQIWTFVSSIVALFAHFTSCKDAEASISHWPRHILPLEGVASQILPLITGLLVTYCDASSSHMASLTLDSTTLIFPEVLKRFTSGVAAGRKVRPGGETLNRTLLRSDTLQQEQRERLGGSVFLVLVPLFSDGFKIK